MEFILSLLAYSLRAIWPIILFSCLAVVLVERLSGTILKENTVLKTQLAIIFIGIALIFLRNYIAVPIINHYGVVAEGRVVSSSKTIFYDASYNVTSRYKAAYVRDNGKRQTVVYWSRAGNIHPLRSSNLALPIRQGEAFTLKYLPYFPSAFIFINKNKAYIAECITLSQELKEIDILLDLTPRDATLESKKKSLQSTYQERCK